jgi:hypothetical protein
VGVRGGRKIEEEREDGKERGRVLEICGEEGGPPQHQ